MSTRNRADRREEALVRSGIGPIAGVDEAGRGPLAGPVVAGQVKSQNNWVTHDGFGRYQHQGGACDFYFEYDHKLKYNPK